MEKTEKVRAKALKLVALACSQNKNEARNAAVKACELIKAHDLLSPGASPASVMETVERVRTVVSDPSVRENAAAVAQAAMAGADLLSKIADLAGKVKARR